MIVIVGSLKLVSLPIMGNLSTSPARTELPVCSRETLVCLVPSVETDLVLLPAGCR